MHRLPHHHPFGAHQPPHCTHPYMPRGYTQATAAHCPPSKKSKSFVPFISNCPLAHTPHCLTHLASQGHLDEFFFFLFSLFPSYLEPVQDNGTHNITAIPSPCTDEGRCHSPTITLLAVCKRICHCMSPSPMQLTNPIVPNLVTTTPTAATTSTTLPPP